jgi:copper(I)-binding protein
MKQIPSWTNSSVDSGQTLEFQPGGLHVMLTGLRRPLVAGTAFDLDMLFEVAGPRRVRVAVRDP